MRQTTPIVRTLRLRILRPYNGKQIESEIQKVKTEKSKEKKEYAQLNTEFWKGLKSRYPDIVDWDELRDVLVQIQRTITPIYNQASTIIFQKLLQQGGVKARTGNEGAAIDWVISKYVYPSVMRTLHNAYIHFGIRDKLKGSFSGEKLKKIRNAQISSPSAISDRFPIPMWQQTGFKVEAHNEDLVIDIPFPLYKYKEEVTKFKPWEKLDFVNTPKKKHIQLILSTNNRRRNVGWIKDWSTEAEIKKVISNKLTINKIEITRGKRINERNYWFVNFVIAYEKPVKKLNIKITGGIDIGVSNPVVCAINNGLNRLSIRDNDVVDFTKAELSRLQSQRRGDRFRRGGHGTKHKFEPSETIQKKYEQRRKKKMEEWASRITRFFLNNGVGLVYMEDIDKKSIADGEDYFRVQLRITWPVKEMQKLFERKLKENGIKVKYIDPKYSSQICSKCGKWNNYFNFKYRKEEGFPPFECKYCNYGNDKEKETIYADYNAARNLANPDFEKKRKKGIPSEVLKDHIKEEPVVES